MSRPKERIPVNRPQEGLFNAFANLEMPSLQQHPEAKEVLTEVQQANPPLIKPGRVNLKRETAHRGGKVVMVVEGFGEQHTEEAIAALGRRLRAACGAGGTTHVRRVEVQGNQPSKIREFLEAEGFQVGGER
jgi:translation initiation factor 1